LPKKRVTFTIDGDLDKKIRTLQASLISSTTKSWSYSGVLEIILEEGLKTVGVKKIGRHK
jgi:hypothetical protein